MGVELFPPFFCLFADCIVESEMITATRLKNFASFCFAFVLPKPFATALLQRRGETNIYDAPLTPPYIRVYIRSFKYTEGGDENSSLL